jgi:hypothetical protein
MADLNTVINEFLRDAQYRVAELSVELDDARDQRLFDKGAFAIRAELILWMDLLFDPRQDVLDPAYNFLDGWDERDIIGECEYLRQKSGMSSIPYATFAGYSPDISNKIIGEGSGETLPVGSPGDHIVYNTSGIPVADPFPTEGGMQSETIDQFFD